MDTKVSLVIKVLWKLISLIYFRVYLEVNVHKNPMCFSRWSVSIIFHVGNITEIKIHFVKKKDIENKSTTKERKEQ